MGMQELKFRPLTANEVEVRLNKIYGDKGLYLLYKDARVDMNILDEVFTPWGWQREHKELKCVIYCGVSIRDEQGNWITKWDAGSESNTEKEKGEASDSFKRACFNWGIGRELYTAPTIRIPLTKDEIDNKGNIYAKVSNMQVEDGKIVALEIVDGRGNVRFTMGKQKLANLPIELKKPAPSAKKIEPVASNIERQREDLKSVVESCNTIGELTTLFEQYQSIINDNVKQCFTNRRIQIEKSQK